MATAPQRTEHGRAPEGRRPGQRQGSAPWTRSSSTATPASPRGDGQDRPVRSQVELRSPARGAVHGGRRRSAFIVVQGPGQGRAAGRQPTGTAHRKKSAGSGQPTASAARQWQVSTDGSGLAGLEDSGPAPPGVVGVAPPHRDRLGAHGRRSLSAAVSAPATGDMKSHWAAGEAAYWVIHARTHHRRSRSQVRRSRRGAAGRGGRALHPRPAHRRVRPVRPPRPLAVSMGQTLPYAARPDGRGPGRGRGVRARRGRGGAGARRHRCRVPAAGRDQCRPGAARRRPEEEHAALLVVGTGRRRPGRALPGSTAERLLHGAPCPVADGAATAGRHVAHWTEIGVGVRRHRRGPAGPAGGARAGAARRRAAAGDHRRASRRPHVRRDRGLTAAQRGKQFEDALGEHKLFATRAARRAVEPLGDGIEAEVDAPIGDPAEEPSTCRASWACSSVVRAASARFARCSSAACHGTSSPSRTARRSCCPARRRGRARSAAGRGARRRRARPEEACGARVAVVLRGARDGAGPLRLWRERQEAVGHADAGAATGRRSRLRRSRRRARVALRRRRRPGLPQGGPDPGRARASAQA